MLFRFVQLRIYNLQSQGSMCRKESNSTIFAMINLSQTFPLAQRLQYQNLLRSDHVCSLHDFSLLSLLLLPAAPFCCFFVGCARPSNATYCRPRRRVYPRFDAVGQTANGIPHTPALQRPRRSRVHAKKQSFTRDLRSPYVPSSIRSGGHGLARRATMAVCKYVTPHTLSRPLETTP